MKRPGRWWTAAQIVSLACAGWCLSQAQIILNQPPTVTKTSVQAQSAGKSLVGRLTRSTGDCLVFVSAKDSISQLVMVPEQAHVTARKVTISKSSVVYGEKTGFTVVPLTGSQALTTYGVTIPQRCLGNFDGIDSFDASSPQDEIDNPDHIFPTPSPYSGATQSHASTPKGPHSTRQDPDSPDLPALDDMPTLVLLTAIASDS